MKKLSSFIIVLFSLVLLTSCNKINEFFKMETVVVESPQFKTDDFLNIDTVNTQTEPVQEFNTPVITPTADNDCKSYWLQMLKVKQHMDYNYLINRYNVGYTKQQWKDFIFNNPKYSEATFTLNETVLCDLYEQALQNKLNIDLSIMIIDSVGVISFKPSLKTKK